MFLSFDYRIGSIMLYVIIIPRVPLTHMTVFISHLHNVTEILFVLLVSLSRISEVSQHRSTRLFLASTGLHCCLPSRCWSIRACHPAKAPLRALLCVVEVRGIKATTNICSVKQRVRPSQWRQNREHEQIKHSLFDCDCLSSGCFLAGL